MAKQRMLNTKFWSDGFIKEKLNPLDRYLFLYFLTNEKTNIAGIYELPISTIASETGLEIDMLKKMIVRLRPKVFYVDGWVYIRNFQKHQSTSSETVRRGIEIETLKIPIKILDKITEINKKLQGMDRVSGGIIYSNLNSNLNSNLKEDDPLYSYFGEFKKVRLTDDEHIKLIERIGEGNTSILITELDGYIKAKGKDPYKDHYATLQNWARRKISEYQGKKLLKGKTII